jgi:hydroxylaminobenzene mutase
VETTPVSLSATAPTRHPLDPEPARSTKARAVFALGLVALLTGPLVGGVVPATIALVLARQARREAFAARGYLTGATWLRRGELLAWAGLVLVCTALVVAMIVGLLHLAGAAGGQDFDSTTN